MIKVVKFLLLEKDALLAKALADIITEMSHEHIITCYINKEDATASLEFGCFSFLIISVESENDIGIEFAREARKLEEYKATIMLFIVKSENNNMLETIIEEFDFCHGILMPFNNAKIETMKSIILG